MSCDPAPVPFISGETSKPPVRKLAHLVETARRFQGVLELLIADDWTGKPSPSSVELILAPKAADLAEALRAIPQVQADRTPLRVQFGINELWRLLNVLTVDRSWGNATVAQDGMNNIRKRKADYEATIVNPLHSAALALMKDSIRRRTPPDSKIRQLASAAEQILRILPMSLDEAQSRYKSLLKEYESGTLFGDALPSWDQAYIDEVKQAIGSIAWGHSDPTFRFPDGLVTTEGLTADENTLILEILQTQPKVAEEPLRVPQDNASHNQSADPAATPADPAVPVAVPIDPAPTVDDPNLLVIFPGRLTIDVASKTVTLDGESIVIKHPQTFKIYLRVATEKGGVVETRTLNALPGCRGRIDRILNKLKPVSEQLWNSIKGIPGRGGYAITLPQPSPNGPLKKKVRNRP
jgi:hypothetical protein